MLPYESRLWVHSSAREVVEARFLPIHSLRTSVKDLDSDAALDCLLDLSRKNWQIWPDIVFLADRLMRI